MGCGVVWCGMAKLAGLERLAQREATSGRLQWRMGRQCTCIVHIVLGSFGRVCTSYGVECRVREASRGDCGDGGVANNNGMLEHAAIAHGRGWIDDYSIL